MFSASDFPHTAEVWREKSTVTNGAETFSGPTRIYASLRCLIEPVGAWRQATILGDVSGLRYHFSWRAEALQDGDEIRYGGKVYQLKLSQNDTLRPTGQTRIGAYQTGFIEEMAAPRS